MSRRRKPRQFPDRWIRFTVECDGKKSEEERHPVHRIARVTVKPRPDLDAGYAVQVDYVHGADDPEDNDYTLPVRGGMRPHMTRRFVCRRCRRDVPLEDGGLIDLGRLLDAAGHTRVRLREVS